MEFVAGLVGKEEWDTERVLKVARDKPFMGFRIYILYLEKIRCE
jgi:hypothetical protein